MPYDHPYLEKLWKEKHKYRDIHKVIKTKKDDFLKKESKVIESIPRLNILKQIFAQTLMLYELNSATKLFLLGGKQLKNLLKTVAGNEFYLWRTVLW